MPSRWWVIGGEYSDTRFTQVLPGTEEEHLGPFSNYDEAKTVWQSKAWATVDSCNRRYKILEESGPKATKRYFVLGGDYQDTGFRTLVPGTEEERIGPFDTYEQAHAAWQSRAWATVDSCTKRFRIVEESVV